MVQSDRSSGCCFTKKPRKQVVTEELFTELLLNKQLYLSFEEFLIHEHCSEALYFYKDTTDFHNKEGRDRMAMKREVDELMDKFFVADSPTFVYIPEYLSAEIWNGKDYPHRALFEDARLDIESLLRTKFVDYCRYINSS